MAQKTDVSPEEYAKCEAGLSNLTFAFIYRCAIALNVDVPDIIEGSSPTLNSYTVTRAGKGQHIDKAHGMTYYNLAASFRKRIAEPLFVRAEYSLEAQNRDIELTTHTGQECDIVIKGTLKVQVGNHQEILHEGDSIYYDSSTPHGMIAIDGGDCLFYAIVLNPNGEDIREITHSTQPVQYEKPIKKDETDRIYTKFVNTTEDENGLITAISFNHEDTFNFAFDVVDELGRTKPDLSLIHIFTLSGKSSPVSGSIILHSISGSAEPTVATRTSKESSVELIVHPGEASVCPYTMVISDVYKRQHHSPQA